MEIRMPIKIQMIKARFYYIISPFGKFYLLDKFATCDSTVSTVPSFPSFGKF